ncbi:MAG: amidase [Chitinophagaceae bacterium]|nr:amidase [Chitinophagaceae bacterium]
MKLYFLSVALQSCSLFVVAQDTLIKQDIPVAARLIDIKVTDKENELMYPEIKDNLKEYEKMHRLKLDNSVPMSLWQSPVLQGMNFNTKQKKIKWDTPKNVKLPENKNELAFYSILQLASLIKNKRITSVELAQFFIERIKKFGDTLHCVISVTEDIALQQAKRADEEIAKGNYRGPLHGIPYGLKDLFAVKGTKTTWGAAPYKEQVIEEDAYVYTRLKEAGAVLIAKFTLGALAMGDYWYGGRTRNPWNLERGSSGSSAGSAAATVAGLVPFAIGTETYGSIVSPSHTCGATGLRPTFGRVSRTGAMTLSWSLDKAGPICRSAEDAAVVFNYIHGADGKDACAVQIPFNYKSKIDISRLKIAYTKNYFDKLDSNASERKVLTALEEAGIKLIPVVFPDSGVYNFDMIGMVVGAESAAAFDEFTRTDLDDQMTRQSRFDWPNNFRVARLIPAVEYINTNRHRYLLMQKVNEVMEQYDAVITPTFGGNQLAITNLTGHPVICLPTGFNQLKLPTSISILGKLYDEATILAVAKAYQDATTWEDSHPEMFK